MANGTRKPISEIREGDVVVATAPKTGGREVLATLPHTDQLLTLRSSSGGIVTTEDHKYLNATDQQWQESQDLDPGDRLLTADGDEVLVEGLDWSTVHTDDAYGLTVEEFDSFYVAAGHENVLVHNCNRVYEASTKHHPSAGSGVGGAPKNGQAALDGRASTSAGVIPSSSAAVQTLRGTAFTLPALACSNERLVLKAVPSAPPHLTTRSTRSSAKKGGENGGPLSPASVRRIRVITHLTLSHAVKWGLIANNVADATTAPSVPSSRITPPEPDALAKAMRLRPLPPRERTLPFVDGLSACCLGVDTGLTPELAKRWRSRLWPLDHGVYSLVEPSLRDLGAFASRGSWFRFPSAPQIRCSKPCAAACRGPVLANTE